MAAAEGEGFEGGGWRYASSVGCFNCTTFDGTFILYKTIAFETTAEDVVISHPTDDNA